MNSGGDGVVDSSGDRLGGQSAWAPALSRRRFGQIAALGAAAALGATVGPAGAAVGPGFPSTARTSVIYVPHQDDDVLSFGLFIAAQRAAGREVHVVLYTDGSMTGVCAPDSDGNFCRSSDEYEGVPVRRFVKDRDAEFTASLLALGVPASNIHIGTPGIGRVVDSQATTAYARQVMRYWITRFPRANHVAYSWIDGHGDHRSGGRALRDLVRDGVVPVGQALFALARWYWQYDYVGLEPVLVTRRNELRTSLGYPLTAHMFRTTHGPTNQAYRQAIQAYRAPTRIGYRSTPLYLDVAESDPSSLLHGYATARYSTRMAVTARRTAGRSQVRAAGAIRFGDYPGFGRTGDPLALAQALDASLVPNPLAGALIGVQALDSKQRLVRFATTRVQDGGRFSAILPVPSDAVAVRVTFAGSEGAGPASAAGRVSG